MEASELLHNRNKCSREGGRGVPLLAVLQHSQETTFVFSEAWKVDGCNRCQ